MKLEELDLNSEETAENYLREKEILKTFKNCGHNNIRKIRRDFLDVINAKWNGVKEVSLRELK